MDQLKNLLEGVKSNQNKIAGNYEAKINQLQSTISYLRSSNSDLHSKNKALALQHGVLINKIEKSNRAYNDLKNLINATDIPILFLDKNLIIKRFTSSVTKIFALVESDIGKPLSQIIDHPHFQKIKAQSEKIINESFSQEAELYSSQFNESFLSSALPYRDTDGTLSGIIITFEEITENKIYEDTLTTLFEKLEEEVEDRNQRIKKLASEVIGAEQKERKRIAQLLHNDVQQYLFLIKTDLGLLKDDVPSKYVKKLGKLEGHVENTLTLIHQLVVNLSPPDFKQNNLHNGISWIAKNMYKFHGLEIDIKGSATVKLISKDILVLLLQMVQELLFNVIKHAEVKAAKIFFEEVEDTEISFEEVEEELHIHVVDKGKGFGPIKNGENDKDITFNFGLSHIEQQLTLIGGHLKINSSPGKGTDIALCIPAKDYILIDS